MRCFFFAAYLALGMGAMPHYTVEDWLNLKPTAARNGEYLDSAEYQLILPATKFYGADGRKQDLVAFKKFLRAKTESVKSQVDESIRIVTLYNISFMDPSQDQQEMETEWELKQRTTIEGKNSLGETDLTIKRGAVPDRFDWYPDYSPILAVGAKKVENKFELDIQCAERDYTQATKFTFAPGTVPVIKTYKDLQGYFPKLFQTAELNSHLQGRLSAPIPVGEISFEWNAEVSARISGEDITFVIGTRHTDLESARNGEEGWTIRPPELNFRVKRDKISEDKKEQAKLLAELERLFNALLASEWNAHEDCGQWNGVKSCPPKFHTTTEGGCVSIGCDFSAPVSKIPRGANATSSTPLTTIPIGTVQASVPRPLVPPTSFARPTSFVTASSASVRPTSFTTPNNSASTVRGGR